MVNVSNMDHGESRKRNHNSHSKTPSEYTKLSTRSEARKFHEFFCNPDTS